MPNPSLSDVQRQIVEITSSGLALRKVTGHLQATDAYRVIYNGTVEVGSIGLQTGADQRRYWHWGLDTVLSRQTFPTDGEAADREDAMIQFRAMWDLFAGDAQRLTSFLEGKQRASRFAGG